MSKIFSTALLVSCAAAQLTTSAWMAGTGSNSLSYAASVITVENDSTTMSIDVKGMTEDLGAVGEIGQTVTLAGNTFYGVNAVAENEGVTVTIVGQCTRKNTDDQEATCTMSTKGLDAAISSACADADSDDELCSAGALDTSTTTTLPDGYFNMVPFVVTAGENLLPSASAAATPSAGSASLTSSNSAKPTSSGSEEAASSGASRTSQGSSAAPEATNAAPLMTMVPALAGLGAAAAFFL
ncbi:hypothetical protein COCC4DRAFT_52999 [Bipolaris maydis ATCC 48331]|uniref:Uncharacterized protein n=2 Tax=Cochliobolus heterostrophus TaxID=5016 RepID=M2V3W2_COCH5|nr:uncharacterized protein COCC4DRAFT_52999 [Bipolaris maydis ATCC 48331]EMD94703.1 hypothetical protein COCHEDRAFT_1222017 [Bipolaris maydis C5]KAH7556089.1 hypothetical protein BM1_06615 [Bipolaris maydis]ENI01585.1 hypothetical protein COCC4DRAFT_52999 [Bipolaris maydis ATCC 48331]KAJ5029125.1 hypothetical protein J3E73DRAFT_421079 [Bipolaris maydis]KAJ5062145.1 hypothetical protein J3E74DRAFT_333281 [Bipolaris maydis]